MQMQPRFLYAWWWEGSGGVILFLNRLLLPGGEEEQQHCRSWIGSRSRNMPDTDTDDSEEMTNKICLTVIKDMRFSIWSLTGVNRIAGAHFSCTYSKSLLECCCGRPPCRDKSNVGTVKAALLKAGMKAEGESLGFSRQTFIQSRNKKRSWSGSSQPPVWHPSLLSALFSQLLQRAGQVLDWV